VFGQSAQATLETTDDLAVIAAGLERAESAGVPVVMGCAPAMLATPTSGAAARASARRPT